MKHEYLMSMSLRDLDQYASALGVDVSNAKSIKTKVALIERARERTADIHTMGMTITVPIKRMRDKTIADRIENGALKSNKEIEKLMLDIVGKEQWQAIIDRCTDEDDTVDVDAFGVIIADILSSSELKNY